MSATISIDMLSGLFLEDALLHNALHKAHNSPDKTLFLGILAGFWVGLGGIAGLSVGGGIPESVRAAWPVLPKFGLAFFFPFALHFIVLFGGELFTGNTMMLTIGMLNKKVTWKRTLLNWVIVYGGNFFGCCMTAYLFGYLTHLFTDEPYRQYVQSVAEHKTHQDWHVIFLRAIPANVCVCMAVVLGIASRDAAGKIQALYFPVVVFVLSSFEHTVANMFFVNIGLMYNADTTVALMLKNQSAAAFGNLIGGAIVMGVTEHLMNNWKSPIPYFREHHRGTLAGADVESTRKARDPHIESVLDHSVATSFSTPTVVPSRETMPRYPSTFKQTDYTGSNAV